VHPTWAILGRMGCDTLVALAPATHGGVTLFAKNSDRPPDECQRIVQLPRRRPGAGAVVRCQYLEVPEAGETAAVLGGQPYWLWGLEHGVNEHRVAIGNETVFTREPLGPRGLLGMDLVRLGLERGRTAEEALGVVTELIERFGQGGSGNPHFHFPYNNAFLVADPRSAWILETSGRHWVARRIADVGNVSNGLALGADWERGSTDVTSHAVAQGWWPAAAGRVDFTAAYADDTGVPPHFADGRRGRGAALLAEVRGRITPAAMRAILRDHYEGGPVLTRRPFGDPHFFSLCMHADPLDNTTAAMVARLPEDPDAVATVWVCVGSPCAGAFLPCYLDGTLPAALGRGGASADPESPWWLARRLLVSIEGDVASRAARVRARWDRFEATLAKDVEAVEAEAVTARRAGRRGEATAALTALMERSLAAWMAEARALVREIEAGA
jgi:secernin